MNNKRYFMGETIGGMYVKHPDSTDSRGRIFYLCICNKCGGENFIHEETLNINKNNNTMCECKHCKEKIKQSHIGEIINGRKIISIIEEKNLNDSHTIYRTECVKCGNIKDITIRRLKNLKIVCPECREKEIIESHIGEKYGSLIIIAFDHKDDRNKLFYWCECECKEIVLKRFDALAEGKGLSCGCKNIFSPRYIRNDIPTLIKPIQKASTNREEYLKRLISQIEKGE